MATKCTVRSIERTLESNGVAEGRHEPYLTTARTMYAQMVHDVLKGATPTGEQALEMVRNSGMFINAFWHAQRTGVCPWQVRVLGKAFASWRNNGEVTLVHGGTYSSGTKHRMASIRKAGAATPGRHDEAAVTGARTRVAGLAATARAMLEGATGHPYPLTTELGSISRWGSATVSAEIDGRTTRVATWGMDELVHRSDEDLLHRVREFPGEVFEGARRKDLFMGRVPDIQGRLDELVAATGLPISLRIAQDTGRADHQSDRDAVWVMMDGYGPSGLPQRRALLTATSAEVHDGRMDKSLALHLAEQRRLHGHYGPAPGASGIEWLIDAVTLARGVTADHVERCLVEGSSPVREGVRIRISGKRILGEVELSPDVLWRGDELRAAGIAVPASVMSAVAGRDVADVIESDLLRGGGTVTSAHADTLRKRPRLNLRVRPVMVPVPTSTMEKP